MFYYTWVYIWVILQLSSHRLLHCVLYGCLIWSNILATSIQNGSFTPFSPFLCPRGRYCFTQFKILIEKLMAYCQSPPMFISNGNTTSMFGIDHFQGIIMHVFFVAAFAPFQVVWSHVRFNFITCVKLYFLLAPPHNVDHGIWYLSLDCFVLEWFYGRYTQRHQHKTFWD